MKKIFSIFIFIAVFSLTNVLTIGEVESSETSGFFSREDIKSKYDSIRESFNKDIKSYGFTEEELNEIKRLKDRGERLYAPYIADGKNPSFYSYYHGDSPLISFEDKGEDFVGTQYLLADIVYDLLGIKTDLLDFNSVEEIFLSLERNEEHTSGKHLTYAGGALRSHYFQNNLHLFDENLFETQLYGYVNMNSGYITDYFDIQEYLFNTVEPIIAYVGSEIYNGVVDIKLKNATYFYCNTFNDAFQLETAINSMQDTGGCHRYPSLSPGLQGDSSVKYVDFSLLQKPVVVISGYQKNDDIQIGNDKDIDYFLINEYFQLLPGTIAGNKKYYQLGVEYENKESQLATNIVGKIVSVNKSKYDKYREYLYDIANYTNVEKHLADSLERISQSTTRIGIFSSNNSSGANYAELQKYSFKIIERIFNNITYKGEKLKYEYIEYNNVDAFIEDLNDGKIDVIVDFPNEILTNSKYKNIVLSQPVIKSNFVVIGDNHKDKIINLSNIYSEKVAYTFHEVPKSSLAATNDVERFLFLHKQSNLHKVSGRFATIEKVRNGVVDYAVVDKDFFVKYRNVTGYYDLDVLYDFSTTSNVSFAFSTHADSIVTRGGVSELQLLFQSAIAKMPVNKIVSENAPHGITVSDLLNQNAVLIDFLTILLVTTIILAIIAFVILSASYFKSRATLEKEINYDFLTGCRSRKALYVDYLKVDEATVLFIDLDKFKEINDVHGHDVGDEMLQLFAARLIKYFGNNHVYRIGGDEFVVMYPKRGQLAMVDKLLQDLARGIELINGTVLPICASIGYTECDFKLFDDRPSIRETLKVLDRAMYNSKTDQGDAITLIDKHKFYDLVVEEQESEKLA